MSFNRTQLLFWGNVEVWHFQLLIIQVLSIFWSSEPHLHTNNIKSLTFFYWNNKVVFISFIQIIYFILHCFLHSIKRYPEFLFLHNIRSYSWCGSLLISFVLCSSTVRKFISIIFKKNIKKLTLTLLYLLSGFHFLLFNYEVLNLETSEYCTITTYRMNYSILKIKPK